VLAFCIFTTPICAQTAAPAPVWSTIAHDGESIDSTSIPAGMTLRYGAPAGTPYGCGTPTPDNALKADAWVTPVTLGAVVTSADLGVSDPAWCYVKELDALETSSTQTVIVNGSPVVVPALPAPAAPPLSSGPHTVVLSATYPPPGDQTAAWFGAGNVTATYAGSSEWESSVFTFTIDGQAMTCTFQPSTDKSNKFTFSCTVPAATPPPATSSTSTP